MINTFDTHDPELSNENVAEIFNTDFICLPAGFLLMMEPDD